MRKIYVLLVTVFLLVISCGSVLAADQPLVNDQAGLLTEQELMALNNRAEEITAREKATVAILTVQSLQGKSAQEYADDYYDENHMGMGNDGDGILLLLAMNEREWAITTTGYGITAFTDYGQGYLMDTIMDDLGSGNYAGAFHSYLDTCEYLLDTAHAGNPLDVPHAEKPSLVSKMRSPGRILGSLLLGFLAALFPIGRMKKQARNVENQKNAQSYVRQGSFILTRNQDVFLYNTVTRVPIPQDNGKSGGGGGSTIHMGSSGTSHGGSHGHF